MSLDLNWQDWQGVPAPSDVELVAADARNAARADERRFQHQQSRIDLLEQRVEELERMVAALYRQDAVALMQGGA